MNPRYLLLLSNIAARDKACLAIGIIAIGIMVWWVAIETSPLLTNKRPLIRNLFFGLLFGTYILWIVAMNWIL